MSEPAVGRPQTVVAILGVGTEVGKTWTTVQILHHLREGGVRAVARKPVQSFAPAELGSTDAELIAAAGGEKPHDVCPAHRWYARLMAPPMAAESLGLGRIVARELLDEIRWPSGVAVGLVETVGGVRSPMADDADSAQFAALIQPDRTMLVADAGLGTINSVRLAVQALDTGPVLVFLNRFDHSELHLRNREWLSSRDGFVTATDLHEVCRWLVGPPP